MNRWDFFRECRREFQRRGDKERLRLLELHREGFSFQETDPDQAVAIYTQGRQLAEALHEPELAFFYEAWRIIALINYTYDLNAALEPALRAALLKAWTSGAGERASFAGRCWGSLARIASTPSTD